MVKASKGIRRGTRKRLKKALRDKFKPQTFMQEFKPKDKVIIKPNPSSHKGMPNPNLKGRIGQIKAKRGRAYLISITVGNKEKMIIAGPEHLRKL